MELDKRVVMSIAIAVIVIAAVALAFVLKDGDDDGGNGEEPGEVLANAGATVYGIAGQPVTFNASKSSGDIQKYWWDMDLDEGPLTQDVIGESVEYTYNEAGIYTVTLTVEGKGDINDTDTVTAVIDLVEQHSDSVSPTDMNRTYTVPVIAGVVSISLKVSYTATSPNPIPTLPPLPNNIDMFVYAGEPSHIASTVLQTGEDENGNKTKSLDITPNEVLDNSGFTVEVQLTSAQAVDFTVFIEVRYHS